MTTHPDLTTAAAYMDEAMKAIALAKQALLGGAGGALFLSTPALAEAEASPGNPYGSATCDVAGLDGRCMRVRGHTGQHGTVDTYDKRHSWPQSEAKHGVFTAGSAAEAGECDTDWGSAMASQKCTRPAGHKGVHTDGEGREFGYEPDEADPWGDDDLTRAHVMSSSPGGDRPDLCPAQWGEPPETMLCSLASGHDGNHATAEGIEWGGRWETAEPHGGAR